MGPESFSHRGREDFYVTSRWYLDEQEAKNFYAVLANGEMREPEIQEVYDNMQERLEALEGKLQENLSGQETNEIKVIKEALPKVYRYTKDGKEKYGEDLGDTIH